MTLALKVLLVLEDLLVNVVTKVKSVLWVSLEKMDLRAFLETLVCQA